MFFPIRDDNPTVRKPILTVAIMAANVAVFLYSISLGARGFQQLTLAYGYTPDYFLNLQGEYIVPTSVYLTPLTSMFMHGGWMHLIGNMLFLWIFGNNIEDYFGPIKFLFFYILSGLAAIALYSAFDPTSQVPLVGASGAIAGVMGAYIVLHPRAEITCLIVFFFIQFVTLPAKVVLGIWFAIQVVMAMIGSSSGGGVAWLAHVGGFIFGWLVLKAFVKIRGGGNIGGRQRIYRMQW
ncbi:MAG: rhomboid family intramembrane serine protease [Candidatus Zixiibacteriota bacterium]